MKVCTDACLFGASVATYINDRQLVADNLLDVGTGTGLLSLMLAQKTNGTIDALEIDEAASRQSAQNFEQSPWKERLNAVNLDALQYHPNKKYDIIVSNPPFFEGDLKSGNKKKDSAKHDTALTLEQLLQVMDNNLSPDGFFALLLPYHRVDFFTGIALAKNYFLSEQILIRHTGFHPFFRGILFFSSTRTEVVFKDIVIKNVEGNYTAEFVSLLKDYYLHLEEIQV